MNRLRELSRVFILCGAAVLILNAMLTITSVSAQQPPEEPPPSCTAYCGPGSEDDCTCTGETCSASRTKCEATTGGDTSECKCPELQML